jgi:sugar phosphate isomerase/epimerase
MTHFTNRFLSVSAILIGCAAIASAAEPASPPARLQMQNPLAVRVMNYGRFAAAAFPHLQSLGVRYVLLDAPVLDKTQELQRELSAHGLHPLVLRGITDLGRPTYLDELEAQLAACEKLGVGYMFFSPKHEGIDKEEAYQRLRKAGEAAKKHGVIIALETHPDLGTNAAEHLETMRRVAHPNVRVNFDTANVTFYNRGLDAVTELKKVIDYVATVELKDHGLRYMDWDFPALGRGRVDLPGALRVLAEHHFRGPVTIEIEGVKDEKIDEEQTKRRVAESVEYLRKLCVFPQTCN